MKTAIFNILRIDPTRTSLIRRQFIADIGRRFRELARKITELVVDDDAFGLKTSAELVLHQKVTAPKRQFAFMTNPAKMKAFQSWLKEQVDLGILEVEGISGKPWTSKYVTSAYRKGMVRAYIDSHKEEFALKGEEWFMGGQEQFLKTAFGQPEVMSKIELLGTRAFEQLKGISAAMSQEMSRHLALGLASGWAPIKMARAMRKTCDTLSRSRARMIARTEIINAHAEGQLDGFEQLGIDEVGVMAEILTAGDGMVCERCSALEGQTFKIDKARGMIPIHPNCRCCWIPSEQRKKRR